MCRPKFAPGCEKDKVSVTKKLVPRKEPECKTYDSFGCHNTSVSICRHGVTMEAGDWISLQAFQNKREHCEFSSNKNAPLKEHGPGNALDSIGFIKVTVVCFVGTGTFFREDECQSMVEKAIKEEKQQYRFLPNDYLLKWKYIVLLELKRNLNFQCLLPSLYSAKGRAGQLMLALGFVMVLVPAAVACPSGCECTGLRMRCASWARSQPPQANLATYQVLDLSPDVACTNATLLPDERHCKMAVKPQRVRRFVLFPCNAPSGTLGSALYEGFLPAGWLGDSFGYLNSLSLRGAGLCSLHKDALRPQARLTSLDLSNNRLRSLNVFIVRKNARLQNLSLADNPDLEIPPDGPLLFSDSVKDIDLSRCGICFLPEKIFAGMPKLRSVTLHGNCLRELSTTALTPTQAPSLAQLDLSTNFIAGMATEEENVAALTRFTAVDLSDNRWAPSCDAVRASGDEVTLADGTVTTWEVMAVQCVVPVPTSEPPSTVITIPALAKFVADTPSTPSKIETRALEHYEIAENEEVVVEAVSWKSNLIFCLTVVACCTNAATTVVLIVWLIKRKAVAASAASAAACEYEDIPL